MGITAIGLAAALALSGCGGSDEESGGSDTTTPTEETGTPVSGGSLTYAIEAEPTGGYCVPEAQLAAGGIQVAMQIYEPIMAYDENLEPQPMLAESLEVSPDNTTFTFKIRSGVTFHDGSALDANVVKDNINTWRGDAETVARLGRSPLLFPFVFRDIADVQAPDASTVVVTTARPWPAFPNFLAGGRYGIAGPAQLSASKEDCKSKLIGTGPFKVDSYKVGEPMELSRHDGYWRKDADGNQLPYLDKLTIRAIEGGSPRFDALDGGSIDAMHSSGQTQFDDTLADPDNLIFIPEREGFKEVGYGIVNVTKAPFDDKAIRLAVGKAIDRDALNEINSNGEFEIANGPFDKNVLGYLEDPGVLEYDPAAAAAELEGKDVSFVLAYATDPVTKAVAEEVKRQLGEVGVTVTIKEVNQSALIDTALGGDFNVLLWRNHPGADPDTQYVWWYSGSPVNFGKFSDARIDKALDEGRVELDPAKRKTIYEDLNKAFAEGGYNLWNWRTEWGLSAKKSVKNLDGATLPDGSKGQGLTWGWHSLAETWIEQ